MSTNPNLPVFISIKEAAQITAQSTRTVRRRISDGTIPAYRLGSGTIRLRLDDVLAAFRRMPSAHSGPGQRSATSR